MEEKLQLKASSREEKAKKNNTLRKKSLIPAVLYGKAIKNQNIKIDKIKFEKIYQIAKESTLIELSVNDQESTKVLIQDVQRDEVTDAIIHVDLYQVKMDEKIISEINLIFIGIAPAVKELNGTLIKNKETIQVKCFPNDLINELEVDISSLKTFDDLIRIKDIEIPDTVEVEDDTNITLVKVDAPRTEEEMKALDEKVKEDVDQVAATEEKKNDEESEKGEDAATEEKKNEEKKSK